LLMTYQGKEDGAGAEFWDCAYELLRYRELEKRSGISFANWSPEKR